MPCIFGIEYVAVIKTRYINVIICIKCKHPFYSYSPYFHLFHHIVSFVQYTTVYIIPCDVVLSYYFWVIHEYSNNHWSNRSTSINAHNARLIALKYVGWDVKWCPVSRITTPLARKRFRWRAGLRRPPGKLHHIKTDN